MNEPDWSTLEWVVYEVDSHKSHNLTVHWADGWGPTNHDVLTAPWYFDADKRYYYVVVIDTTCREVIACPPAAVTHNKDVIPDLPLDFWDRLEEYKAYILMMHRLGLGVPSPIPQLP